MNDQRLACALEIHPAQECSSLISELRTAMSDEGQVIGQDSAALLGSGVAEVALILGSSGAVAASAKVLVAWLAARKGRTIKINNTELKGYSMEEAINLLVAVPPQRQVGATKRNKTKGSSRPR